jgi:hypothetical protein
MTKRILNLLIILFLIILSLPAIFPYFHPGYFPTHDGEWAVVRLGDMFRLLRDFQIPARYSGELNFGYGYPLFNFTYPLPYYLGMVPYLFRFGFVGSIKILFAGSVLLSAVFMFLASKTLWKNTWAGVVSAVLYVYFPYRMVDLYVRGSIGESLSFALFPLLLFLAIKLIEKFSLKLVALIGISVAFLIMTHNIMTVLFMPLYIIFALVLAALKNKKAIKAFLSSIFLGLGLSAFFWIPAILEKGNILLSKIPIANRNLYFVSLRQLIIPGWGYGVPTDMGGFSYQLGVVNITVFIITALSLLFFSLRFKKYFADYFIKIAGTLTVFSVCYLFLLFKPSEFLWHLPLLSEINYPWIVLGILGFLLSLIAGFFCRNSSGKYLMIILAILSFFTVLPYAQPEKFINNPDSYYLTNEATTTSSDELMPLWVKSLPTQRAKNKVELQGPGNIQGLIYDSKQIMFSVDSQTPTRIMINTIYYPGWKIYIDQVSTKILYDNDLGVMQIVLPAGHHLIVGNFTETPLRLTSDIISLLSLLIVLILFKKKYAIS